MSDNVQTASATVYQFPLRGRFSPAFQEAQAREAARQMVHVEAGSGWYHQQAIDDTQARKN